MSLKHDCSLGDVLRAEAALWSAEYSIFGDIRVKSHSSGMGQGRFSYSSAVDMQNVKYSIVYDGRFFIIASVYISPRAYSAYWSILAPKSAT
jgi:hypothetical protein